MRPVAPREVPALVALADRLLTRCFNGNDDGREAGALAAVAAVAIWQLRGQTALAVGLLARRLIDDDRPSAVFGWGHLFSLMFRPRGRPTVRADRAEANCKWSIPPIQAV